MKKLAILLFLLLAIRAYAANDFSGDSTCKADWNLESGALTADSKGTNTLTNGGVDEDAVNYKQGACSGAFVRANSDYMYITNANMDAGMPLKSTGSKSFTFALWFKSTDITLNQRLIYKGFSSPDKCLILELSSSQVWLILSPDGEVENYYTHATDLSSATWYHLAIAYNNSTGAYRIRIHDESGLIGSDISGTRGDLYLNTVGFYIGYPSTSTLGGNMDEVVAFDRALSTDEIDEVWSGTFGEEEEPPGTWDVVLLGGAKSAGKSAGKCSGKQD